MAKTFTDNPDDGDVVLLHRNTKRFVYREGPSDTVDGKWDLEPLVDRFIGDSPPGPILSDELPVLDENFDTVYGVGRVIEHTFDIEVLDKLETI